MFSLIHKNAQYLVVKAIGFYQRFLSPDHSFWAKMVFPNGYCRFNPTCSNYAKESIAKHGLFKGGNRAILRILRCNPWGKGGNDPVE